MNHVDSNPAPTLSPPAETPSSAPATPVRAEHRTTVGEAGSFSTARCDCGWFAPARRSRDKARRDAEKHLAEELAEGLAAEA